jgi:hypothetical protein
VGDLAMLRFHVPSKLSATKRSKLVIAIPMTIVVSLILMSGISLSDWVNSRSADFAERTVGGRNAPLAEFKNDSN